MQSPASQQGQMIGLGLGGQAGVMTGQLGANANTLLQGGNLTTMGGLNASSPVGMNRGNVQALSYAALQGTGSPGGTLAQVQGLRLATGSHDSTTTNLGNLESALGVGIANGLQGGLSATSLQQMQQLNNLQQVQAGLGGSLGGIQLGNGSNSGSLGTQIIKADQGARMALVSGLPGLQTGVANGVQGGSLGGLGGTGMLGTGSVNGGLGVQQGAQALGAPNQGTMLAQQQGAGLQMISTNAVSAALMQQQQQQQQLSLAASQHATSLGRGTLPGTGGITLMQGQMGLVQPDSTVGMSKEELLPPDAAPTLYVDGMPADITRREFAHVFRPFDGYKGSRVVVKERETGKPKQVYGFVDFNTPQEATYAKQQLQGYPMDLEEETTNCLNISYARPLRNPNIVGRRGNKPHSKA